MEFSILFATSKSNIQHNYSTNTVKTWNSATERDSPSCYNGPDFEDLEDKLQEAFDEYLGELGVDNEIFDFIDATAVDKEHREYMRWLENMKKLMWVEFTDKSNIPVAASGSNCW